MTGSIGMNSNFSATIAGVAGAFIALRADLRRRGLSLAKPSGWHALTVLDVACPTIVAGVIVFLLVRLVPIAISKHAVPLDSPLAWAIVAGIAILAFVWAEGRREIQFQRPAGIVCGESLILIAAYQLIASAIFPATRWPDVNTARIAWTAVIATGAALTAIVVAPFVKGYEGHRILDRLAERGESVQAEYMPPTPECPHPERWKMVDTQTSELEVTDFLKSLVITLKPRLIVETGTFLGYSTLKMAEGLQENGFGRIVTIEYDPQIFAKAKDRIDASGLGKWIENRNESSLDARIDGTIDLFFSDSHLPIREQEIRRFLPQIDARGLILMHDASSEFRVVREAALKLEREGLISTVLVPTPRGLVIAQKREGRQ